MATRHSSATSSRSSPQRGRSQRKPISGNLSDYSDEDEDILLDADLLRGESNTSPPTSEAPEPLRPSGQRLDSHQRSTSNIGSYRLVIAIDYGTTFTGVAFATPIFDTATLGDIAIVDYWGPKMGNHNKIPSVYSYSPKSSADEQQWGDDISDAAVTMVNTKLELDVQDNKHDELELILQVLDGTGNLEFEHVRKAGSYPAYTWKEPEDIVTDYLTKVFQYLNKAVKYFGPELRSQIPVDIVITVPVKWSYRAKNSTLRAVRKAGFNEKTFANLNDIIMVTEPEAAAIYTARHLKEDKSEEFLRRGECFILCDAGGGTVDLVSYQVVQLEPLELKEMTIASSKKCGSAYIDKNFKLWLYKILGDRHYRALEPKRASLQISAHTTEGSEMRKLIKSFDARKKVFSNKTPDMNFNLPKPLDKLNIPGKVKDGKLTITNQDMRNFFDPCVDSVIDLIDRQRAQIEMKHYRVRNVFLVGGFGESAYLQEELKRSLDRRDNITMRRPETAKSWTAVVQGAVIYGVEKANHENATILSTCSKSYGIVLDEVYAPHKFTSRDRYTDTLTNNVMVHEQISWLVRRGDLILSDDSRKSEKEFRYHFQEGDERSFQLPIYEYPEDDDDLPDRFDTAQHELIEKAVLRCNLSNIPDAEFERLQNHKTRQFYYVIFVVCKVVLKGTALEVSIHCNGRSICTTKIEMELQGLGAKRR